MQEAVLSRLSEKFLRKLEAERLKVTTAESCTGGLLAALFTDLPGSSQMFDRGFVTYSNESKTDMLGVSTETLKTHGAVSEQTAREMAAGALKNSRADIAIAITGIAGPSGGTEEKPVGLVYVALNFNDSASLKLGIQNKVLKLNIKGDRSTVREGTIEQVLTLLTS